MSKQALAVKYRPKKFEDVVEQTVPKSILTEQLKNKTFKNCLLFCGGAGTGKAQPLYSKVLTPTGFITMGEVTVGTDVITGSGRTAMVIGVYPQGSRPIYEITLSNGHKFRVSDEHLNVVYEQVDNEFIEYVLITKDLLKRSRKDTYVRIVDSNLTGSVYYAIRNIKLIGEEDCQCIYVDAEEHTYITDGYVVTHNTTSARIFANEINDFKGHTIEIDAASHNGVDDARKIIEDARTQSLDSEYKVFVIDECHMISNAGWNALLKIVEEPPKKSVFLFCLDESGLVCTKTGMKKIKDVQPGEYVWTGDDFHVISNVFNNGQRECFKITLNNGEIIKCTPNHQLKVLQGTKEVWKKASELTLEDVIAVYHSYGNFEDVPNLTDTECWFLGYLTGNGHYEDHSLEFYTPKHKLDFVHNKLNKGVSEGWLDHFEDVRFNGSITTQIHFPRSGMLKWYEKTGCDYNYTKHTKSIPKCVYKMSTPQLILFAQGWYDADGECFNRQFLKDIPHPQLGCASEQLIRDLQMLLIAHGFDMSLFYTTRSNVSLPNGRAYEKDSSVYSLYSRHQSGYFVENELKDWLFEHRLKTCVPYIPEARQLSTGNRISSKMIERSELPDLQGNKWYNNIKCIEPCGVCNVYDIEVPDVHEFIYNNIKVHNCTTDPQKIPATILSRVQRYNFQKISQNGIVGRLKYIIEQENKEIGQEASGDTITYEDSAIEFIAKLADGGMRDSITLLDKAIGYSNNLTLSNVLEALGSVNYDTMFELTDALNKMNATKALETISEVYKSGLDLKQFIKQYSYFVLDLCKYKYLRSFDNLQMPTIYKDKLDSYNAEDFDFFCQLLDTILELSKALKDETVPKPLVESKLLLLCMEA